jgi:plasmid maintenance system antidote protein VapI
MRSASTFLTAEILNVRRATLSDPLHGKAALTPEMALSIE